MDEPIATHCWTGGGRKPAAVRSISAKIEQPKAQLVDQRELIEGDHFKIAQNASSRIVLILVCGGLSMFQQTIGGLSPVHWLMFLGLVVVISIANVAGYVRDDNESGN